MEFPREKEGNGLDSREGLESIDPSESEPVKDVIATLKISDGNVEVVMNKGRDQVERLGGDEGELREANQELKEGIDHAREEFLREIVTALPNELRKIVSEHTEVLKGSPNPSPEVLEEHFRLDPNTAKAYFSLVQAFGMEDNAGISAGSMVKMPGWPKPAKVWKVENGVAFVEGVANGIPVSEFEEVKGEEKEEGEQEVSENIQDAIAEEERPQTDPNPQEERDESFDEQEKQGETEKGPTSESFQGPSDLTMPSDLESGAEQVHPIFVSSDELIPKGTRFRVETVPEEEERIYDVEAERGTGKLKAKEKTPQEVESLESKDDEPPEDKSGSGIEAGNEEKPLKGVKPEQGQSQKVETEKPPLREIGRDRIRRVQERVLKFKQNLRTLRNVSVAGLELAMASPEAFKRAMDMEVEELFSLSYEKAKKEILKIKEKVSESREKLKKKGIKAAEKTKETLIDARESTLQLGNVILFRISERIARPFVRFQTRRMEHSVKFLKSKGEKGKVKPEVIEKAQMFLDHLNGLKLES